MTLPKYAAKYQHYDGLCDNGYPIVVAGRLTFDSLEEVEQWRRNMEEAFSGFQFSLSYPATRRNSAVKLRSVRQGSQNGLRKGSEVRLR